MTIAPVRNTPRFVHLTPPADEEKIAYLAAPQHRWVFWLSAAAFCGVFASFAGLAAQSYWTLVFFAPIGMLVVEQVVSLRTSTLRRRFELADHVQRIDSWRPEHYPSVDIFLPTAGEELDLLENTYHHVSRVQWLGELNVVVLDDGGRDEVAELAASFGFWYLARPSHEFKKAGNLQYGLERTRGDCVLILDADFVPRPDFLHETVPYLDDPATGIVQTPQYFSTSRALSWLERAAGATQELFYRHIQPSRDAVGAAICVGTSALYRRAALEAIGGFPLIGHSEDVFTGVLMGRQGFRVTYAPIVLSRGRCPDTLGAFLAQQYRWCEGSMALLADRRFHQDESMTLLQRLSFWAGFIYYITTAMNAVLGPLPILVMVYFFPRNVVALNMLPLGGVLLLWLVVLPRVSLSRWRLEVLRVQSLYGFAHLVCIADGVRGKVMEWVATGTAHSRRRSVGARVQAVMVPYLTVTQLLTFTGLIAGAYHYGLANYWANILLALLSAYVFVPVAWAGRGVFTDASIAPARPPARRARGRRAPGVPIDLSELSSLVVGGAHR